MSVSALAENLDFHVHPILLLGLDVKTTTAYLISFVLILNLTEVGGLKALTDCSLGSTYHLHQTIHNKPIHQ